VILPRQVTATNNQWSQIRIFGKTGATRRSADYKTQFIYRWKPACVSHLPSISHSGDDLDNMKRKPNLSLSDCISKPKC